MKNFSIPTVVFLFSCLLSPALLLAQEPESIEKLRAKNEMLQLSSSHRRKANAHLLSAFEHIKPRYDGSQPVEVQETWSSLPKKVREKLSYSFGCSQAESYDASQANNFLFNFSSEEEKRNEKLRLAENSMTNALFIVMPWEKNRVPEVVEVWNSLDKESQKAILLNYQEYETLFDKIKKEDVLSEKIKLRLAAIQKLKEAVQVFCPFNDTEYKEETQKIWDSLPDLVREYAMEQLGGFDVRMAEIN